MVPGRATFRNLSRYSEYCEKTLSRGFAREHDWLAFNIEAIESVIPRVHRQALVLDASFISKSGKRTHGLDKFWNGSASRAEKGLEISVLSVLDVATRQAYTLSVEQTPAKHDDDAAPAQSRMSAYLEQVRQGVGRLNRPWLTDLITDGYYSKTNFIDGVVDQLGLHLIGKLRADANMRYYYDGPKRPGRGRQRQYGSKVEWSDLSQFTPVATDEPGITLYQKTLNHKHFKRALNVVVVVNTQGEKPRQAVLFCTDLTRSALDIYGLYSCRFQIEFLIRDAKQATGLSHCQARDQAKLHFHFNASLAAASIAKLEVQRDAGGVLEHPFSIHSLQRRAFNRHLVDRIIEHLDQGQTLTKFEPAYEHLCNYGIISQQAS